MELTHREFGKGIHGTGRQSRSHREVERDELQLRGLSEIAQVQKGASRLRPAHLVLCGLYLVLSGSHLGTELAEASLFWRKWRRIQQGDCERSTVQNPEEFGKGPMARLRERQPCRRGSGRGSRRGSASHSPAANEHHHCCCCFCHRRARAQPLQVGQFTEVGSSNEGEPALPVFGLVVFTLGRSGGNEGISAHISVLFTTVPENDGSVAPPGEGEPPSGSIILEGPDQQPAIAQGKETRDTPVPPPEQKIQDEAVAIWAAMWEGVPEGMGWCTIEEETSPEGGELGGAGQGGAGQGGGDGPGGDAGQSSNAGQGGGAGKEGGAGQGNDASLGGDAGSGGDAGQGGGDADLEGGTGRGNDAGQVGDADLGGNSHGLVG